MNNNISKITTTIHLSREIHNRLTITNQLPPLNTIRPTLTTLQGITPLQKSFMPTSSSMHCTGYEIEDIQATTRISPMNKQRQICTSSLLTEASSSVSLVSTCISQLLPCIYQLHSYFSQLQTYIYPLHPRLGFHSILIQASNSRATSSTSTQLLDRIHTFQDHAMKNNHISQLLAA
jgi:hypothetical protein